MLKLWIKEDLLNFYWNILQNILFTWQSNYLFDTTVKELPIYTSTIIVVRNYIEYFAEASFISTRLKFVMITADGLLWQLQRMLKHTLISGVKYL